jgi:hypothetical protein
MILVSLYEIFGYVKSGFVCNSADSVLIQTITCEFYVGTNGLCRLTCEFGFKTRSYKVEVMAKSEMPLEQERISP